MVLHDESRPPDQAVILAAGLSTRLRPLTDDLPKCMVPVGARPLIAHTIEHLRSYGVVGHRRQSAPRGAADRRVPGGRRSLRGQVRYSWERNILGTAGGTRHAARFFDGPFFVWYGDNLSTIRLDDLWAFHASVGAETTVALYQRQDTRQSGVAEVDRTGRIRRFVEKPKPGEASGTWVNAGILALEPSVLQRIPTGESGFRAQVLPDLVARGPRLFGYEMSSEEKLWWIDTPDDLRRVREAFGDMVIEESRQYVILARAPFRISLGGGGTDLPSYYQRFSGFVITAAINKYVYLYLNRPAADDLIRVKYSTYEQVSSIDEIEHDLVRPALKLLDVEGGLEIASMADVSAGTGLGSSGTYLVALLTALHELKREQVPAEELAEQACHIEMDLAGHPVGKQDHYIAARRRNRLS